MSLLHKLLEKTGGKYLPRDTNEEGKRTYLRAIGYSSEFRRIEAIPRRIYPEPEIGRVVKLMTNHLKKPKGEMELWPIQALALKEISEVEGAFCPIAVGKGKALISLLAPVVLGAERPLLLVPAALRDQTNREVIPEMAKHWRLHPRLEVRGYSEISLEKNAQLLDDLDPDLVILDECHYLKHKTAGRTKRVTRFLKNQKVKVVALSGTIAKRSLKEWAHVSQWCLGPWSPVPNKWTELSEWSDCLDAGVPDEKRPLPGALKRFCEDDENPRQGFRRRLVETPGVVASEEDELGVSLRVQSIGLPVPKSVADALGRLRGAWETPNGQAIAEAVELWRHAREISLGFYYRWDPPAPRGWLDARREWARYVRETLKHNRRGLDTELQVWNESSRNPHPEWREWRDIKDSFKPNTVAEWLSPFALDACKNWLEKDDGIVWVEHRAFGDRLQEYSGYKYFGAGDNDITMTTERAIIASIPAHSEGKNLQRWSRNLVVAPPSTGMRWEQLLGRTHRHGQQADEVSCDVFLHVQELRDCFDRARADAEYLEQTYGSRQKLNFADIWVV